MIVSNHFLPTKMLLLVVLLLSSRTNRNSVSCRTVCLQTV